MMPARNVIPFPSKSACLTQARLNAALERLVAALDDQRRQGQRFREATGRLAAEMRAMQDNLGAYRARLGGLALGLAAVHDHARRTSNVLERAAAASSRSG